MKMQAMGKLLKIQFMSASSKSFMKANALNKAFVLYVLYVYILTDHSCVEFHKQVVSTVLFSL